MATDLAHGLCYRKSNTNYFIPGLTTSPGSYALACRTSGVTRYFDYTSGAGTGINYYRNNGVYRLTIPNIDMSIKFHTIRPGPNVNVIALYIDSISVTETQNGFAQDIRVELKIDGSTSQQWGATFSAGTTSKTFDSSYIYASSSSFTMRFLITTPLNSIYSDAFTATLNNMGTITVHANLLG